MHVLTQLGISVDLYLASETDQDAIHVAEMNHPRIRQQGPVESLTDAKVGQHVFYCVVVRLYSTTALH